MKPTKRELEWLGSLHPDLVYEAKSNRIVGELSFCACYDETIGKVRIEGIEHDEQIRNHRNFIADVFDIVIELDAETAPWARLPRVREVGGRKDAIASRLRVPPEDLHFYSASNICCLCISYSSPTDLTIQRLILDYVIPFFYRLSFVERSGLHATRNELWDEYSHGDRGLIEHEIEMWGIAQCDVGRNDPCPCGSQNKFKLCHLNEVNAWKRSKTDPVHSG